MDKTPLILTGPPGCGKSYWIQKYAEQEGKQLFVCPCRKDRTLRDGRQKLHIWARRTEPAILWLEGADDLTPEAQAFLRRILETHAPEVFFVLECRDSGRLQEPIRSRCAIRRMTAPTWKELSSSLKGIYTDVPSSIEEYITTHHDYSYRRAKQCAFLARHYPQIWQQVMDHSREEEKERDTWRDSSLPFMDYVTRGYHPGRFIENALQDSFEKGDPTLLRDYGYCVEAAGSPWAFWACAFDRDRITPAKQEE